MLSYKDSLKILKESNALLEGHFVLSSGLHSSQYVQCAQLLSKETIFSERVNGKFELRRGFFINKNSKVLIVEDVITTGKSSLECSELVTKANAEVIGYACLIDRSNNNSKLDKKIVSQIELNIPTYSEKNLPESLKSIPVQKPGSRELK